MDIYTQRASSQNYLHTKPLQIEPIEIEENVQRFMNDLAQWKAEDVAIFWATYDKIESEEAEIGISSIDKIVRFWSQSYQNIVLKQDEGEIYQTKRKIRYYQSIFDEADKADRMEQEADQMRSVIKSERAYYEEFSKTFPNDEDLAGHLEFATELEQELMILEEALKDRRRRVESNLQRVDSSLFLEQLRKRYRPQELVANHNNAQIALSPAQVRTLASIVKRGTLGESDIVFFQELAQHFQE